jgi:hypothetical protein
LTLPKPLKRSARIAGITVLNTEKNPEAGLTAGNMNNGFPTKTAGRQTTAPSLRENEPALSGRHERNKLTMKQLIGMETKKSIKDMLNELIDDHHQGLNEAMGESEDDRITVSISVGIERLSENVCDVECSIAYTLKKVKDKVKKHVNEMQIGLFPSNIEVIKDDLETQTRHDG